MSTISNITFFSSFKNHQKRWGFWPNRNSAFETFEAKLKLKNMRLFSSGRISLTTIFMSLFWTSKERTRVRRRAREDVPR